MWKVEPKQLVAAFRDGIGERWTQFVDALIRTQAAVSGVPDREILTNQRLNIADGGVDTQVNVPIPGEPTGRFASATCWQYKAEEYKRYTPSKRNKKLAAEIRKEYVSELIQRGYAYRLCICDCLPSRSRSKWLADLKAEKDRINPAAPDPLVLTADDIAPWACRFLGLLREFFHPEFRDVLDLHSWGRSATHATPVFVPVAAWGQVQQEIARHADLAQPCHEVVLQLQGEAGVGKTRSAYETLCQLSGAAGVVLYTADEQLALRVARQLLNNDEARALLIADECLLRTRVQLEETLRSVSHRARVLAITNSGVRPASEAPELWLSRLDPDTVQEILHRNFPHVPEDRRRLYAGLSGGFVKLAAQLCHDDPVIERYGLIAGTTQKIQAYLDVAVRSDPEKLEVLQALSLVRRVGYREDVVGELDDLCRLVGRDRARTQQIAYQLKDLPGFVAQAGRYFYVTPAIIAHAAFQGAWQRWVASDPAAFLQNIPARLFETFLERVAESGTAEMRQAVADFFRVWLLRLEPHDLTRLEVAKLVVMLVDTWPEQSLPVLRGLMEAATLDELRAVRGDSIGGDWGPRRHLVWLAERLARLAAYFDDAERILVQLALAESEPHIANNATRIWQQLFRVFLSGTETPFLDRLRRLEQRFLSGEPALIPLAFGAAKEIFNPFPRRMEGRPVVAGRITPPDWRPSSRAERNACYRAAFDLVCRLARSDAAPLAGLAQELIVTQLSAFLARGWLEDLQSVLPADRLPANLLPRLIEGVESFLHFERQRADAKQLTEAKRTYGEGVRRWLTALSPKDLARRLVAVVGRDPWRSYHRDGEAEERKEIAALAEELWRDRRQLEENLLWLCSPEARSAFVLGQALGRLDGTAALLDTILAAAEQTGVTALARGYVSGLLATHSGVAPVVNERLDGLQVRTPNVAYELILAGGEALRAVPRLLYLVDRGSLPAPHLHGVTYVLGQRKLAPEELLSVLQRLAPECHQGNVPATEAALDILWLQIDGLTDAQCRQLWASEELRALIRETLRSAVKNPGRASYAWLKVAEALQQAGVPEVVALAVEALVSDAYDLREQAEKFLADRAGAAAEEVMQVLGRVLLDDRYKHHFFLDKYVKLFRALPVTAVAAWLETVGVEGARRIARHLPPPFLDPERRPQVPELTAHVLQRFEADERTFHEFCAGVGTTEVYWVEDGKKRERDAEVAEEFLGHPLRRIREWARQESVCARADAERERMEAVEENVS
ncbi:MAG: hypothetical protein L0Z62_28120 [Gemmataceae bacterium]|nr:hypothetical protein [Gemmataceae bacterium]